MGSDARKALEFLFEKKMSEHMRTLFFKKRFFSFLFF